MKKLLITGAAGFIGSHLVERCVSSGYTVKAFIHYNSKNSWGWLEDLPCKEHIEVVSGDIRDYDSVYKALEECDSIFHLAALIGIPYSYTSPLAYIRTNVEGTYNVLEACKEREVKNIVITSTSETNGTAQYVPMDEKHPLVGQSPYAATKIGADQLGLSYYNSFNLPVKIVRPFNTYGPRQSARAIIPTTITQLLAGKTSIRLGNLLPTRDLTFVKDTANGFLEIMKSDRLIGQVTNIGMGTEISIGRLVEKISEVMSLKVDIVKDDQRARCQTSEVERLCCNNTKIMSFTEWKPQYDLDAGLEETIVWFKEYSRYYKSEIYNI